MLGKYLENTKNTHPLIHCITNYVTVCDVANTLLACGASPVMTDEEKDAEDILNLSNGLYLNIGTLNERTVKTMLFAAKKAKSLNKPVLLDPVGAGASAYRTKTAVEIIKTAHPKVIRGNISEIKALASNGGTTNGVDASLSDMITKETLSDATAFAKDFALSYKTTVAITGKYDIVTDGKKCFIIENGCPEMRLITGTGCMLSAVAAAYAAANTSDICSSVAAAVCLMGLAGELGLKESFGNASHKCRIIDYLSNITPNELDKGAKYEVR